MKEYLDFWRGHAVYDRHIVPDGFEQPQGAEHTKRLLEPHIKGKFIDFGCGHGRMAQHFKDYIGYDISADAVKECKQKYPQVEFKVREPLEEIETNGTAVAFTVLLHIPDDLIQMEIDVLKKCDRVIIAEMMGRDWRGGQTKYVYNRDAQEYVSMMGRKYTAHIVENLRYGKPFTYLVFE